MIIASSSTVLAGGPGEVWQAVEGGPPFLLVRDITEGEVISVSGADRIWIGEQINPGSEAAPVGAGALLVMRMEPLSEVEEEFNAWYDTEHLPRFRAVQGLMLARRYRALDCTPRYAALYHFSDPAVCSGNTWRAAGETPWTLRMRTLTQSRHRTLCVPARRSS